MAKKVGPGSRPRTFKTPPALRPKIQFKVKPLPGGGVEIERPAGPRRFVPIPDRKGSTIQAKAKARGVKRPRRRVVGGRRCWVVGHFEFKIFQPFPMNLSGWLGFLERDRIPVLGVWDGTHDVEERFSV